MWPGSNFPLPLFFFEDNMEHIDTYESTGELISHPCFSFFESQFRNLYCHTITTEALVPDSIYINNRCISSKHIGKVVNINIDISSTPTENQLYIRDEGICPVVFRYKGRFIGGYLPIHNILYLCDVTHIINEFTIELFTKVSEYLRSSYVTDIDIISDAVSIGKDMRIVIGDNIYSLKLAGESKNYHSEFIEKVTAKARETILKIKQQYLESFALEKARLERIRKSVRPMPEVTYEEVMKRKLLLSKIGSSIIYSFPVTIVATHGVDESAKKSIQLDDPIKYDGILHFYINESNIVSKVRFTDITGVTYTKHLHTLPEGDVCIGTTNIIGKKITNLADIVRMKEVLADTLTKINVYSCYIDSDKNLYNLIKKKLSETTKNEMGAWIIPKAASTSSE